MSAFAAQPAVPFPSSPDIDQILQAIRAEARERGSRGRVGSYSTDAPPGVPGATHGLRPLDMRHAADFLALPLDVFIGEAYRHALGREPDSGGASHYQRMLLRGRLTRMEVLGRLRFSPEGRMRGVPVPGLAIAFLLATAYRVPFAGPFAGLVARALRLPHHLCDRSGVEATALASGTWMKR
jgi:O-antigen chain-terminating methyltransferase